MIVLPPWPKPLGYKYIDLGLQRPLELLRRLGGPHGKLPPVAHVAGTNGKGSVIAFLRAIMEAAGYRVHVYTSPQLVFFNERIVLAGKEIEDSYLLDILERTRKAEEGIGTTYFESITAAAFLAFSEVPADILLLETGMGGRLDATNVIEHPALTVITPVSFDHMAELGDTLAKIAAEKAGIIKRGVPCVVSRQEKEAIASIRAAAKEKNGELYCEDKDWRVEKTGNGFAYDDSLFPLPALAGAHQIHNAGAAIACVEKLPDFSISADAIKQGLMSASWPGRLQRLVRGPLVEILPDGCELWLDGGHNKAGGEVLGNMAREWRDGKKLFLIAGMLKRKDHAGFFAGFNPEDIAGCFTVAIPGQADAESPEALMIAARGLAAQPAQSAGEALRAIAKRESSPFRALICGSLYLAGSVLAENS